jgi:hypothetical protein
MIRSMPRKNALAVRAQSDSSVKGVPARAPANITEVLTNATTNEQYAIRI